MITLIFGSDSRTSRNKFLQIKNELTKGNFEIINATFEDLEGSTVRDLSQATPLMYDGVAVFLEGEKRPPETIDWNFLTKVPVQNTTCIWIGETLLKSSRLLKNVVLAKGEIFNFEKKKSQLAYRFTDAVLTRSKKESFNLLEKLYQEDESSVALLALLTNQFRVLIALNEKAEDFLKSVHPFVLSKIKSFAKNFKSDEVLKIYQELLIADVSLKTGGASDKIVMANLLSYIVK